MAIHRLSHWIHPLNNTKLASSLNYNSFFENGNLKYLNPNIFHRNAGKNNTKAIALAASYSSQSAFQNSRKIEMFLSKLTIEEKQKLVTILQSEMKESCSSLPIQQPTSKQIFQVGLHHALPFVGFGFLDNFIMIVAGDYIDMTIGTMFGISTMAAAALGNAISDVAGVGSAQFVETFAAKLGVPNPNLDHRQASLSSVLWSINIGRAIGVAIGCVLGMCPLLFLPTVVKLGD